jgi:hypothetical protein
MLSLDRGLLGPRTARRPALAGGGWASRALGPGFLLVAAGVLAACHYPTPAATTAPTGTAAADLETAVALLYTPTARQRTPDPQATPTPSAAGPPLVLTGCSNRATFVADVSIPDDTVFSPGASFTKTWRLRNNGTCPWTVDYALVFSSGDAMGGPASVPLGSFVPPGSEADISADLVAPSSHGTYRGNWLLRAASGDVFGIGSYANQPFWVQVIVGPTPTPLAGGSVVYSFADQVCAAEWRSGVGLLPCPGTESDPNGFIVLRDAPRFENGVTEDEPALYTHPQDSADGVISGRFPALTVPPGAHFRTIIGCAWGAEACGVLFQLNYRIGDSPLQNLGQWIETYDGDWRVVDVDLSPLAGQTVTFSLAALANGSPDQDRAYWLGPIIVR